MQTCSNCGEENPDRFRLCGMCGAELAPPLLVEEARKTVTIVFSDLAGSTALGERLDSESLREVLGRYFEEMRTVLERHGGTVEKYIGDAIMAVFGLPVLHEDDALRAVRAAAEMKETLARLNEHLMRTHGVRLENRTGVNTGEVVAGDVRTSQRLVTGDAVNVAARLEQAAPPLEVLIGEPTYRLVRGAADVETVEPLALKGKSRPMPAYRLLGVTEGEGIARRLDAPLVGRRPELAALAAALREVRQERVCRVVTILGPAGVGKSRLVLEFLRRTAGEAVALRGRCLSYGEGITFWPLAEVTRTAAGIGDDDTAGDARAKLVTLLGPGAEDVADRLGAAIGLLDASYPVEETFWAARRLLEILGRRRPTIVVIDDIHWAEDTFLDLLRFVAEVTVDASVLLLCSARPELLEDHPGWADLRGARTLTLAPLTAEESTEVVENLLGWAGADERLLRRVTEAAEGNPLFVEQMVSMLIDNGILARDERGGWVLVGDVGALEIPPTIGALLSARLDRLGAVERTVIERGAVVGQVFFRGAVEELVPEEVRDLVPSSLDALGRKQLIAPEGSTFAGQEAYRFGHILIRDAAYHGLLKRTRADLHVRFVDWVERVAPERVMEYEEIRGYHLEQAFLILLQLGPLDGSAREVGVRGGRYLSSAGRRAFARGDMPAAANLLQRAAALLPPEEPERRRLLLEAGEASMEVGEFAVAERLLRAAMEAAIASGDGGLEITARLMLLQMRDMTEPSETEAALVEQVESVIPTLEALDDHDGLARAWRLLMHKHFAGCRWGAAEEAARRMLDHADRAGNRLFRSRVLGSLAICALYGPTPVPVAIRGCEELLGGDRKADALITCALSQLEAMRGDFDRARDLYRSSRASLEELGWRVHAALTSINSGPVELLAGDPVAAEAELRRDYETLSGLGERYYLSTIAGFLAEALHQQGRHEEAERFAGICEEAAADDDVSSQVLWRCVRGKLLARRSVPDEGERLVREAVAIIRTSDEPDSQGGALMDLAQVLRLAGREEEARAAAAEALALFEAKGNTVSAARAREVLAPSEPTPAPAREAAPARPFPGGSPTA